MSRILILLITIKSILSILIGIDGTQKNHCLSKYIDLSDIIHLNYLVTGEEKSDYTTVRIFNPSNKLIYEQFNKHDGELTEEAKESGHYKLCFYPETSRPHFVSFEFYTQYERGHTLNMAKDRKFYFIQKIYMR